jgi:hypothetical protein
LLSMHKALGLSSAQQQQEMENRIISPDPWVFQHWPHIWISLHQEFVNAATSSLHHSSKLEVCSNPGLWDNHNYTVAQDARMRDTVNLLSGANKLAHNWEETHTKSPSLSSVLPLSFAFPT